MEKLKERVEQILGKRPKYKEILNFYLRVKEEQEKSRSHLHPEPLSLRKEWKDLLSQEGFSLIEKKDFPIDIEASINLFGSLCEIAQEANPHLARQVTLIREAVEGKRLNLKEIFSGKVKEEKVAEAVGLDPKVFTFLIYQSKKPSIEEGVEILKKELEAKSWSKGYCPLCGSLPSLALLRGEGGKRYLRCSYCGFEWRVDRLFCPFCGNREQGTLPYFFGEGEESFRMDTCEKCHQYLKTIDTRVMEVMDPELEDIATLHLDLLASQKGYRRPVPHPWNP